MRKAALFLVLGCILAIGYPPLRAAVNGAVKGTYQPTGSYGVLGTAFGGVYAYSPNNTPAIRGDSAGSQGVGVAGTGYLGVDGVGTVNNGAGVAGLDDAAQDGTGVYGTTDGTLNTGSVGVYGYAPNGTAVFGYSTIAGWAGYFDGDVGLSGTLYKSAGAFRIDHPLDPMNKYLSHSFVESNEMKNVYDGVVTLENGGEADVELPGWFESLNKDFRYQLTCIGEHAPVYVASEVTEGKFRIAGGFEGLKVSWQVTGVRRDLYAAAHPIVVETLKPNHERGLLLHPELYKMPDAAGLRHRMIQRRGKGSTATR